MTNNSTQPGHGGGPESRSAQINYLQSRANWINGEGHYTRFLGEKMVQGFVIEGEEGMFRIPLEGDRPLQRVRPHDIVGVSVVATEVEPFLQATVLTEHGVTDQARVDLQGMTYQPRR